MAARAKNAALAWAQANRERKEMERTKANVERAAAEARVRAAVQAEFDRAEDLKVAQLEADSGDSTEGPGRRRCLS